MVENAEYLDFASLRLVKVDDGLLNLNAAASGKAIVPCPTGFGVPGQHVQRLIDRGSVVRPLVVPPRTPRVQQYVIDVPVG